MFQLIDIDVLRKIMTIFYICKLPLTVEYG